MNTLNTSQISVDARLVSSTIIQATNYQLLDSRVLTLDNLSTSNMEALLSLLYTGHCIDEVRCRKVNELEEAFAALMLTSKIS